MSNLLGKTADNRPLSVELLRKIYGENAILLDDAASIVLKKLGISLNLPTPPLPLISFNYRPLNPEFLRYTWSEYPYLNKQVLVNSCIKEVTNFDVMLIDVLKTTNPLVAALVKRELLIKLLDSYTLQGGTFTILTLWGVLTKCVLTGVSGINDEGLDGTSFRLSFAKPNFSTNALTQSLNSAFKAFSSGGSF